MTGKEIQNNFEAWWYKEGSGITPLKEHDWEEHSKRISEIAWTYGANKVKQDVWERNSRYYNIKP
tara:strand:- start:59 stop:253 length:195 start_codon:yes stop_codon:yes gene_type:complete